MQWTRLAFVIALVITTTAAAFDGAPARLWGDLEAGPYAVGYRVVYERDRSRPWNAHAGRPIRIAIWYPAATGVSSETMRYVDYLHYTGGDAFADIDEPLDANDRESWIKDLTEVAPNGRELAARLFATPTAAHRDAAPAPGRFPLILYSAGLGGRGDSNAELGEYLASHGFVVATVPNVGRSPQNIEMGSSAADLEGHARDLEFAWKRLRRFAFVDDADVATAGHSVGGVVALYLAMRHGEIKAVVSLDGSFGFKGHVTALTQLKDYAPSRVTAALLDLRRANHVQKATHDRTVVRALRRSDRYLVSFPGMFHGDFTEFGTIAFLLSVPLPPNDDGRTRRTGFEGNQHAYRAALGFLDATLHSDKTAMARLRAGIRSVRGTTLIHLPPRPRKMPRA
ncbi:MAG TPA: acyl-CoA thioester hydrolase/BAAT C-terminal domain-containing protein [Thermoanaerobaculia bacterium]|nr:acyl-CoA thioester hydrolase/BAAT C-terminal domain-containing protein [Thermoanaerobaculia bacterium]